MSFWKTWHYSVIMTIVYMVIFNIWLFSSNPMVYVVSGLLTCIGLTYGLIRVNKDGYFGNRFDLFLHACVIFDIFLESIWEHVVNRTIESDVHISIHDHNGFYLCTIAFVIVIGPYHAYHVKKKHITAESPVADE